MVTRKYLKITLLVIIDILVVVGAAYLALLIRLEGSSEFALYLERLCDCLLFYAVTAVCSMVLFRLYSRVWTFAAQKELFDIIKASLVIEGFVIFIHVLLKKSMPRSYYFIHLMLIAALFLASRFGISLIRNIQGAHAREKITRRIMVIGAGAAAAILIRDFAKPGTGARIVCAIDDNPAKKNDTISGVRIVGNRDEINKSIKKYDVNEIVIAIPSASSDSRAPSSRPQRCAGCRRDRAPAPRGPAETSC